MNTSGGTLDLDASGSWSPRCTSCCAGTRVCITWVDCYGDFNYGRRSDRAQALVYDTVTVTPPLGAPVTTSAVSADEAEEGGGCSTVPGAGSSTTVLMMLVALVATRRRD